MIIFHKRLLCLRDKTGVVKLEAKGHCSLQEAEEKYKGAALPAEEK